MRETAFQASAGVAGKTEPVWVITWQTSCRGDVPHDGSLEVGEKVRVKRHKFRGITSQFAFVSVCLIS